MAFPVEHRGSLDVEYDHPGNLSAGDVVARHGDVRAENRANVTHHPIALHDRGRGGDSGGVPPESRANARATTTEVDFGAVVVGETRRRTFALENAGATPAAFELVDARSESSRLTSPRSSDDASSPFTVAVEGAGRLLEDGTAVPASEGVVPGYGSVVVVATFAPKAEAREGGFEEEVVVRWIRGDGDEKGGGGDEGDEGDKGDGDSGGGDTLNGPDTLDVLGSSSVPYTIVTLRGVADPAPVRVARDVVDFRTCAAGCAYREAIVVRNGGDVAARCDARAPESSRASSTSSRSISSSSHTPRLCFRSSFAR